METPHVSHIDTCYLQHSKQTILIIGWFHLIKMTNEYFLPRTSSLTGGVILILFKLCTTELIGTTELVLL